VSDAIVTISAHRCLSRTAWLNSCRVAPHHFSVSSDHSRWGRPLLFEPSIHPENRHCCRISLSVPACSIGTMCFRLVKEDAEYGLFVVTLFQSKVDQFKVRCRENKSVYGSDTIHCIFSN